MDKKDISKRLKQSGKNIGLDDQSSDIIIRNLDATTLPMCIGGPLTVDEQETDDFKIIFFALDGSSSMRPVEKILIEEFNQTIIPGLKEGAKNVVAGIRIGGLVFGSDIKPLWQSGFQPLSDLPELNTSDYWTSGWTSLYAAALDSFTATAVYALELREKTGSNPEVIIVILSDGANNQPPYDPFVVRDIASKLSSELFTLAFAGFETGEQVDFREVARDMGFREIFEMKMAPGESPGERRRRFRHLLGVMSSSLIGQIQKAPAPSGSGFWQI